MEERRDYAPPTALRTEASASLRRLDVEMPEIRRYLRIECM